MNYALALLVYSVRYPAVFWHTNKCFGIIFSLQLLVNGVQSLLSFAGMSVLYKVVTKISYISGCLHMHFYTGSNCWGLEVTSITANVSGRWCITSWRACPIFVKPSCYTSVFHVIKYTYISIEPYFISIRTWKVLLLNFMYNIKFNVIFVRYHAFLNEHREKQRHIFANSNNPQQATSCYEADSPSWGYLTHCAALCALIAMSVTNATLLHDYTVVYYGSLDGAVLTCVIAAIGHLFIWVLVWLFLTIKHKWTFKIKITVGRATVRSARSVRLITDIELASRRQAAQMDANRRRRRHDDDEHPNRNSSNSGNSDVSVSQPLLVVGNGRAYTVSETTSRKAIMSVVQKAATAERSREEGKIMQPSVPGSSNNSAG